MKAAGRFLLALSLCLIVCLCASSLAWAEPAADAFSSYEVAFTYEDRQYVLPGDESVELAFILETLGLPGDVTAVCVSDPALFSAGLADGDWIITAHKAFVSVEWMKATISGTEYEITVTDDQSGSLNGLLWKLDTVNGILTITGVGNMPAIGSGEAWDPYDQYIKEVSISSDITSIGDGAFADCTNLTSINLPQRIKTIGKGAFSRCSSLKGIWIPSGVTSIGEKAFEFCRSIKRLAIPEGITSIGMMTFYKCLALEWVSLPESLKSIGEQAFYQCEALKDIAIPAGVTSIGSYAFNCCRALPSVTIPSGVTSLGIEIFNGCNSLTSVTIQEGVKSIEYYQFASCNSLQSILIPSTIEAIDINAFANCSELKEIGFLGSRPSISSNAFTNVTANALYLPGKNWSANDMKDYGGTLSWYAATIVDYDANGGDGAPAFQMKADGMALTLSAVEPVREGYDFVGWAESNTAEAAEYLPGGSYDKGYGTTLYAVWKLKTYAIVYDANGGEGAPEPQTKTHGINLALSSDIPSREGHTFLGWATAADAGAPEYQPGRWYYADSNLTLYAVWVADTYQIMYDANGGEGAPEPQTKTYGVDLTLSRIAPTRYAYDFCGWALSPDAQEAEYQSGARFSVESDATLYAVWQSKPVYTITYDANGGEGAPEGQSKLQGETIVLRTEIPTRQYCRFLGWATSADAASAAYQPGANFTTDADTTLYAVWESTKKKYTITYYNSTYYGYHNIPDPQTKIEDEDLTLSSLVPTQSSASVNARINLYANGGQLLSGGEPVSYLERIVGGKSEYTFRFWSTNSSGSGTIYYPGDVYTNNASVTLYPQWWNTVSMFSTTLPTPTRDGYIFKFWGESTSATSGVTGKYTPPNTATRYFYAIWEKAEHTVSYDPNGGEGGPESQTKNWGESLIVSDTVPSKNGWYCIGWAEDTNATVPEYLPGGNFTKDEDTKLYAVWVQPDLVLPASLREIGEEAFAAGAFRFVKLSEPTVRIGANAFTDCPNLAYISIPESTTEIDEAAFGDTTVLFVYGKAGSTAETFAKAHGFVFLALP